jgi:hypothetical protein
MILDNLGFETHAIRILGYHDIINKEITYQLANKLTQIIAKYLESYAL